MLDRKTAAESTCIEDHGALARAVEESRIQSGLSAARVAESERKLFDLATTALRLGESL